jgi:hypothetical protein
MIAFPESIDASAVVTFELVNRALLKGHGAVLNLGLVLIRTIDTIRVSIANPFFFDADSSTPFSIGFASEFSFGIALSIFALSGFAFVRIIQAVVITVANIDPGDAIAIVASEQVAETSPTFGLALIFGFVFSTIAILVTIAIPGGGYTSVIGTSEGVGRTRSCTTMDFILVRIITAIVVTIA